MSCSSRMAGVPSASAISWSTVAKSKGPDRPALGCTALMVDLLVITAPSGTEERNSTRLPAHIRRGSSLSAGRKLDAVRLAWPSIARSVVARSGRKHVQCASGGRLSLAHGATPIRSRVAASSWIRRGSATSRLISVLPTNFSISGFWRASCFIETSIKAFGAVAIHMLPSSARRRRHKCQPNRDF